MENQANAPTAPVHHHRINIQGNLLNDAKDGNIQALRYMFYQFLPQEEKIIHADYYGYFGFWFVGFHSFACLTEKRLTILQIGPFKKVIYRDGFYENMTSGAVMQPSKFWLYFWNILGALLFLAVGTVIGVFILGFLVNQILELFIDPLFLGIASLIASIFLLPFALNFITMIFYRLNPCGFFCMIRERVGILVFVNREKMTKANYLYRLWSQCREDRIVSLKHKSKKSD